MEDIEQAETEVMETSEPVEVEAQESISDIFGEALKGKAGSPEETSQREEEEAKEQPEDKSKESVVQTPYGEITLDEAKKIAFKDEKEFQAFLDRNPFLKEGFLRQSDYTRKTTQVAEERKKYEEERKKFEETKAKESEAWGSTKPSPEDMGFFQNLWHVYQYGSDQLAGQISAFAKDVSLISQGKNPVGPLAGANGQSVDFSKDSQVIGIKREFDQYRSQQERKEKELEAQNQAREQEKATAEVNGWLSEKQKAGVTVTREELQEMARLSVLRDDDGKRLSLDALHDLALARLGRTIKKVVSETKDHANRTPKKPASRVPSNAKPEASSLDDIFQQGLEEVGSER